jgi:hypothetical protein
MKKAKKLVHKTISEISELATSLANVIRIADVDMPVL